jgi:hypothetical protein
MQLDLVIVQLDLTMPLNNICINALILNPTKGPLPNKVDKAL